MALHIRDPSLLQNGYRNNVYAGHLYHTLLLPTLGTGRKSNDLDHAVEVEVQVNHDHAQLKHKIT